MRNAIGQVHNTANIVDSWWHWPRQKRQNQKTSGPYKCNPSQFVYNWWLQVILSWWLQPNHRTIRRLWQYHHLNGWRRPETPQKGSFDFKKRYWFNIASSSEFSKPMAVLSGATLRWKLASNVRRFSFGSCYLSECKMHSSVQFLLTWSYFQETSTQHVLNNMSFFLKSCLGQRIMSSHVHNTVPHLWQ